MNGTKYIELSSNLAFLLVDESSTSREFLADALRRLGYRHLTVAPDALTAFNILRREKIGFVIADKFLPNVSGLELLREIRETPQLHRIPFMLAASEIDGGDALLAGEYGVDAILSKPFVLKDVSKRVSMSMANFMGANNIERTYDYARELYLQRKTHAALEVYRKIIQAYPNSIRARVGAGRCLRVMKHYDIAEKLLIQAIDANRNQIHALHELAVTYLEMNRAEEAIAAFKNAISASPKNPIRYEIIGSILMEKGRYAESSEILEKAVKLGLSYPILFEQLGKSLFHLKKHDQALYYFQLALRGDATNLSFLNSIAICMKEMGRYVDAIDYYNTALKYHPDDHRVMFNKALCLIHKKDLQRAKSVLERILKIDPDYEKARAKLAQIDAVLKNTSSPCPTRRSA